METTPIEPALTPEEWAIILPTPEVVAGEGLEVIARRASVKPIPRDWVDVEDRPAAIAAAALYRQPFGFTRDDVDLCRSGDTESPDDCKAFRRLADKIAALLPPESSITSQTGYTGEDGG